MFSVILLSLIAAEPASTVAAVQDAPVRISINNDRRFVRGDRAKVKVRVEEDGFLVVVQADADGHVRVLYPLDPDDDNFVRGDRTYEVRGRGDRESFTVDEGSGEGAIFAAVSRDPFRFADYVVNDHWDYNALNVRELPEDPEPELTELVRRMSNGRFEYDYLTYTVFAYDDVAYGRTVIHRTSYVDPFCSSSYYFRYDCDPYYYSPSRYNVNIHLGGYNYYDRYRYGYPYAYGYGYYDPFYYGGGYYNRPIYVYPRAPFPYRDRLVSPRGFKQGNRLWDGDSYRDRTASAAGSIQATHTVYGEPPVRRAAANDPGRSPLTPTATRTSRDLSDRPSRSKSAPTKARSSDAPAARPSSGPDRSPGSSGSTPRRSRSSEERPTVERAPTSRERVTVPERRAEPARARPEPSRSEPSRSEPPRAAPRPEPSRAAPARSAPARSAPSGGGGGGGGGGGRRTTR